jgi:hypothetical protein
LQNGWDFGVVVRSDGIEFAHHALLFVGVTGAAVRLAQALPQNDQSTRSAGLFKTGGV